MDDKTKNVLYYTILSFFMVSGMPYFYLNKFKQGFTIAFIQCMLIAFILNYMSQEYFQLVPYHGYIGELNIKSAWEDLFSGELISIPFYWLYPLVFIPGIIQASHITYLMLKKKI